MQISSFYVPPYALSGDEFPVHVIFNGVGTTSIRVKCDKELSIKEIYNVPENGYSVISEQEVLVSEFEVKGYLGLVFGSDIKELPQKQCNIWIEVAGVGQDVIQTRSIQIFKALLKIESVPSKIKVSFDSTKKSYVVDKKINLLNLGLGSAIVSIKPKNNNTARLGMPENYRAFEEQVKRDLLDGLDKLKSHFPENSKTVDDFSHYFGSPEIMIAEVKKDRVKRVFDRFAHLLEDNEDLASEFAESIVSSYLKNIQLITEISTFLEYLNSTAEGKVILTNAIEVLATDTASFNTGFELGITDLAFNEYPDLEIQALEFEFSGTNSVPVYLLFNWTSGHDKLEGQIND